MSGQALREAARRLDSKLLSAWSWREHEEWRERGAGRSGGHLQAQVGRAGAGGAELADRCSGGGEIQK